MAEDIEEAKSVEFAPGGNEDIVFVNHGQMYLTPEEAYIQLGARNPSDPTTATKLVTLVMTHSHLKRLIVVMARTLASYEMRFGEVEIDPGARMAEKLVAEGGASDDGTK